MKKVLSILICILLLTGCGKKGNNSPYRLSIFETSDIHGYIANKVDDNYQYILSYISDKVHDVRGYSNNYNKDLALLLDAGDIYQGYSLSNLLEGESMSAAYNLMDYDAVALGNHEFDWGIESTVDNDGSMVDATNKFKVKNNIPVLASNLYQNDQNVDWIKDYIIVNKVARNDAGEEITVKVAIIGYVEEYSKEIMSSLFTGQGYSIKDDISIPENISKKLESEGLADVSIILCHADARKTAEKLSNNTTIDLVLGGHTHMDEIGRTVNNIPYLEPKNHGGSYNYLELVFNKDDNKVIFDKVDNMKNISISDSTNKMLNISSNKNELDPEMVKLTDEVIDALKDIFEKKIGYIETSAKKRGYINGSGSLSTTGGNWMSSIYLRATNADVAFTNLGGIRYDFDVSGTRRDITIGEIYSNYPFDNYLYKYQITYEDLLKVLEYALSDRDKRAIISIIGIDCYYKDNKVLSLVKDKVTIYKNGKWINNWNNKTLTIVTNEYVATNSEANSSIENPLMSWNNTNKLIEHNKIDSISAIEVLTKEAKDNNGLLKIDTKPHFIESN